MAYFYQNSLKKLISSLCLLLVGLLWQHTSFAAPKNIAVAPAPAWIKQLPQRIQTSIDPKEVSDGYHYLQRATQWEVAREEVYYQNTYKITAEEGVQNSSELKISFDPNHEKLYLHKVVVWRNGKPIHKLDLSKVKVIQREQGLEQRIFDESLTAVLILEDIRVGDVVDYACTIKGRNPVFGGKFFNSFYLQFYDPVDELLVHIVAPEQRKLNYKLYKTDSKPTIVTANGNTSYTWHLNDVPSTPVDNDLPAWYDPYPGVYVSEYNTWQEVAAWALPMYELKEQPSKAMQAKIDSIKTYCRTREERVVAALRFVQDEVRYLGMEAGIGGYKPRSPSAVFAKRFGDCKDKSLLLSTMLQQMGIEAYPALVNSGYRGQVKDFQPSPYAFNHCIVQVNYQGRKFWYDPTISKQRGTFYTNYLPDYQKALVLSASSKGLEEVDSPGLRNAKVKVEERFLFDNVGGTVKLEVKTEYFGSEADVQRSRFATTSLKDIEKSFLNFYANTYPDIEASRPVELIDYETGNQFTTLEEYTIDNLWEEQEEDKGMLQASFYPQVLRDYIYQPRASKRSMPMGLSYPVHVEHEIQLYLPEPWPINATSKEVKDEAFTYTSEVSYTPSGNVATMKYTYTSLQDHVLPENMSVFVRNQKLMLEDLGQDLTYNKNVAVNGGNEGFRFSWVMFGLLLLALGLAIFRAYKLYYYDPELAPGFLTGSGERIGGWLVLPLIGLFVTPLIGLKTIVSNGYLNHNIWENLLTFSSPAFSPDLAGLMFLEMLYNVGYVVFCALALKLYLDRRSSAPMFMMVLYVCSFAFQMAEYIVLKQMELPEGAGEISASGLVWSFISAAVWVPYFNLSHRVKDTFVVRLHPPVQAEEPELFEEVVSEEENELVVR